MWAKCNTTACIAGWTNAWAGRKDCADIRSARIELGITMDEALGLFWADSDSVWSKFAGEFAWDLDPWGALKERKQITSKQAAEVLRRIARGEVKL